MIDWNGNGKIDPVDIGITVAAAENAGDNDKGDSKEHANNRHNRQRAGCLTAFVVVLLLPILFIVLAVINI